MSKIYNEYLKLKEQNPDKLYLFKSGKFYIFVGNDCDTINNYVVLKKTNFSNESQKCGFPENVLNDYLRVFNNHKLNIEIVKEISSSGYNKLNDKIIKYLKNIDINQITPVEAFKHLTKLKELINDEEDC